MNREKQNKARQELKDKLIKEIGKSNNVLIELPTGTGKTGIALEQGLLQSTKKKPTLRFYVPETTNIISIEKEIEDRGFSDKYSDIHVLCYRSIHTITEPADVTIYDETHHLFGEVTFENFQSNRGKVNIFVSATIKEEHKFQLEEELPDLVSVSRTYDQVVEKGILPDSEVYIWRIHADDSIKDQEVKYGKKKYLVTQQAKIDKFRKDISYSYNKYNEDRRKNYRSLNRVKRLGSERKRYLSTIKTELAKEILKNIPGRKIMFCGSVEQSQEVGGKLYSIVGKNTKKDNDKKYNDFNDKKIDTLTAVGKLQESVNLVECRTAILVQLGNQAREFIQKRGRALRVLNPVIHLLVVSNSKDEDFLETTLKQVSPTSIKGDYTISNFYDVKPIIDKIYSNE